MGVGENRNWGRTCLRASDYGSTYSRFLSSGYPIILLKTRTIIFAVTSEKTAFHDSGVSPLLQFSCPSKIMVRKMYVTICDKLLISFPVFLAVLIPAFQGNKVATRSHHWSSKSYNR